MAEQRMRELGREGGVAWLAERLRRGDLERSMVDLAAYCGDAEAAEVLGACPACQGHPSGSYYARCRGCGSMLAVPKRYDAFGAWLRGLERWPGAYTWRDGAAGMARWLCVVAEREGEQRVREAICERLREWVLR